jgi:hypothetical protein
MKNYLARLGGKIVCSDKTVKPRIRYNQIVVHYLIKPYNLKKNFKKPYPQGSITPDKPKKNIF